MTNPKDKLKLVLGSLADKLLPWLRSDIDNNRNARHASKLKELIVFSRTHRAKQNGDVNQLEKALSSFWKGAAGEQFHETFNAERFDLFLKYHSFVIDELANMVAVLDQPFTRVVEIGCGDGQVLNYCRPQLPQVASFVGLDINEAAISHARALTGDTKTKMTFESGDALAWLSDHPERGTIILTNGGVLEYFSRDSVARLFAIQSAERPSAFVLIEPLSPEHDLSQETGSLVFGRENSFSHNYPHLLGQAGYTLIHQSDFENAGIRWLVLLATRERT